jgi:hypothetical protein
MAKTGTLHFKTLTAANLFSTEITGQLADGMWENTKPYSHWEYWCMADVVVDGKVGHEGSPKKTNYNLKSLLKYISEPMMNAVKVAKMPWFDMSLCSMSRYLSDAYYLENEPYCLMKKYANVKNIRTDREYTIKDRFEKACAAIGAELTDHFKKLIREEVIHQLLIEEDHSNARWNEQVDANWALVKKAGVTDLDSLHYVIREVNAVQVTPTELLEALAEITEMMKHSI